MFDYAFRFASLLSQDHAFTLHKYTTNISGRFWSGEHLAPWAGMYLTHGDGMTQHASEIYVSRTMFGEYLASLAAHVQANPQDMAALLSMWPHPRYYAQLDFALSVVYREGKTAYYSLIESKTSTAASKRHDKRWEEIPRWADGSVESAYRLLMDGNCNLIDSFALYNQLRDYVDFIGAEHPSRYFKLGDEQRVDRVGHAAYAAFKAVDYLVQAHRLLANAEASLTNAKSYLQPPQALPEAG